MMSRSKVTKSVATQEVAATALAIKNQPPLPPPQNTVDPEMFVLLYLNLVRASQLARFIEANPIETPILPMVIQPEHSLCLQTL